MKQTMTVSTMMLACVLLAAPAFAQFIPQATAIPGSAPEGINYQGRLEDGGFPVNATKSMIFRVYSAPIGGVLLWTSPAQAVPVALGLFSAVVPVPTTVLVGGGARYLEVSIDSTLMSPRELLNSVPYALIAKSVEGNIDVSTAGLAINANSSAVQPALYISSVTGNVGVGTGAPLTAFDVGGSAAFGSAATKSTFSATGALNTSGKVTAPDYTATYGINASTAVFAYVLASSITTTGASGITLRNLIDSTTGLAMIASSNEVTRFSMMGVNGGLGEYFLQEFNGASQNSSIRTSRALDVTVGQITNPRFSISGGSNLVFGIGTTAPATKLHMSSGTLLVDGDGAGIKLNANGGVGASGKAFIDLTNAGNGGAAQMYIGGAQANDIGHNVPTSGTHRFYVNSNESVAIDALRLRVGIGGGANTSLINIDGSGSLNGSTLTWTAAGNVGIGVASPNSRLDVRGNETNIWGAQPFDSTLALYSNTAAAVDVGPSLRFSGQSGAGVNPFTFGSIRGVKDAVGASYGGRLDFATIAGPEMGGLESTLGRRMSIDSAARIHINNSGFAKTATLWVEAMANHTYALQVSSQNNTGSLLVVKADGNVGIGTVNPASKFHMSSGTLIIDGNVTTSLTTTGRIGAGTSGAPETAIHAVSGAGGTAMTLTDNTNATLRFSFPSAGVASIASNEGAHSIAFGGQSSAGGAFTERFRINNVTGNSTFPSGLIGIGTGVAVPSDRLEVASGNLRLTQAAGVAGSVKLFSMLTVLGTDTCTVICGANTVCLGAWTSAGVASTCATAAAANRCLCSGFGN